MTARQKRNREAAIENMYYLYKKYYPMMEKEILQAIEEEDGVPFEVSLNRDIQKSAWFVHNVIIGLIRPKFRA